MTPTRLAADKYKIITKTVAITHESGSVSSFGNLPQCVFYDLHIFLISLIVYATV